MSILKALKAEQDEERMRLGNKWVETDRLFVKWNGEPITTRTHDGWFREFCKDHDFKFCTIHSFRHFYASALFNANVDVATVSSAMGHSVIGTTFPVPNSNTIPIAVPTDKNNHNNNE